MYDEIVGDLNYKNSKITVADPVNCHWPYQQENSENNGRRNESPGGEAVLESLESRIDNGKDIANNLKYKIKNSGSVGQNIEGFAVGLLNQEGIKLGSV